uniref:KIB1-4 beta-propeller domain-containing protein n=1 Tax=Oryza glumipatula TaxID=40148 RepID=A0A0E0AQD6_9ORYZ
MARGWEDLPPDLLVHIAGGFSIQAYTRLRGVCAAWRDALRPPSPSLLVLRDRHAGQRFAAWCVSPRMVSTALHETLAARLSPESRCVGSGDGWVAAHVPGGAVLVNPHTGDEIPLHSFPGGGGNNVVVFKVVFAPNPTPSEFTAAAITGGGRVVYTTNGNSGWTDFKCPRLGAHGDGGSIADVVYHDHGGGKKVVYCLTAGGDVHVLRLPAGGQRRTTASLEPLFDKPAATFYPAAAFAPPYDTVRTFADSKNLAVCGDGQLYQIWRDDDANATMFVLRYHPRRRPCWLPPKDLGGHAVFIGKNNAVALRGDDGGGATPAPRANCVYWTDVWTDRAKVFDVVTGESTLCFPGAEGHSVVCWYHLGDVRSSSLSFNTGYILQCFKIVFDHPINVDPIFIGGNGIGYDL